MERLHFVFTPVMNALRQERETLEFVVGKWTSFVVIIVMVTCVRYAGMDELASTAEWVHMDTDGGLRQKASQTTSQQSMVQLSPRGAAAAMSRPNLETMPKTTSRPAQTRTKLQMQLI